MDEENENDKRQVTLHIKFLTELWIHKLNIVSTDRIVRGNQMQWDPNDVVDPRVVDASQWWINLKDYEKLEPRSGVYLLANSNYTIKYINTAEAHRMVEEVRDAIEKKKNKGATQVRALYTNSTEKARSLKEHLIKKYNPVNNRK
jgi:hypothetical protein